MLRTGSKTASSFCESPKVKFDKWKTSSQLVQCFQNVMRRPDGGEESEQGPLGERFSDNVWPNPLVFRVISQMALVNLSVT